jgi:hypothetical protein
MKPFKENKHKMKNLVLLFIVFIACNSSFSQNNPFKTIQFNVPLDGAIKNSCGLEVKGTLVLTKKDSIYQATLSDEPSKYLKKNKFILAITVTNKGKSDIIISDWTFQAICPENSQGQQWNETSFVNLITPYIPNSKNIVLKPGEKKGFNTAATDFYWCLPKHEKSLMTPPCGFTAIIICSQVGTTVISTSDDGFFKTACKPIDYDENNELDPELLALIEDFKNAQKSGNSEEASRLKKDIIEITGHAFPDKIDDIKKLLQKIPLNNKPITPITPVNSTSTKITPTNNIAFSDWLTIKTPYHAMQIRYKLEKQEGTIGYFRAQMRIDFDDKERCKEARCLGYAVSFGYPKPDNESNFTFLNYKFYNSYTSIYTIPDLIPINLLLPDGSKRMLRKDGFNWTTNSNSTEKELRYYFDKSVDLIITGSPIKCNNFIESKALILK